MTEEYDEAVRVRSEAFRFLFLGRAMTVGQVKLQRDEWRDRLTSVLTREQSDRCSRDQFLSQNFRSQRKGSVDLLRVSVECEIR
jgi:hypothetical protein